MIFPSGKSMTYSPDHSPQFPDRSNKMRGWFSQKSSTCGMFSRALVYEWKLPHPPIDPPIYIPAVSGIGHDDQHKLTDLLRAFHEAGDRNFARAMTPSILILIPFHSTLGPTVSPFEIRESLSQVSRLSPARACPHAACTAHRASVRTREGGASSPQGINVRRASYPHPMS